MTTLPKYHARVQMNPAGAGKVDMQRNQELFNGTDKTRPNRLVPSPAPDPCVPGTGALSSGKRKLDKTDHESLPAAKRIDSAVKESHEQALELEKEGKYKFWNRKHLLVELRSYELPDHGTLQELRERLYNATQKQTSPSQTSVKQNVTSNTSSEEEPSDMYTSMSQKELRKECAERLLPLSLSKKSFRLCLRLYDAARALGLTPEECLEAQRATIEHSMEESARSVSPRVSRKQNDFETAFEDSVQGHNLGNAPRENNLLNPQGQNSLEFPEYDTPTSTYSRASSDKAVASSSATSLASTFQTRPGPLATLDYNSIGEAGLRSLCKARSLKQNGSPTQLRIALIAYDKKLIKQASKGQVQVHAGDENEKFGLAPSISPPPPAFIDLDSSSRDGGFSQQRTRLPAVSAAFVHKKPVSGDHSSSQDGEIPQQRTQLVGYSAAIRNKEPVSDHHSTVNKVQRPRVSHDNRITTGQGGQKERVSAWTPSDKFDFVSPYKSKQPVKPPEDVDNASSPWSTSYPKQAMGLQQPLVSLLNLSIEDTKNGPGEEVHQEIQIKTKPLSEHALKVAEKEIFSVKYVPESPYWICCCEVPSHEVGQKQLADLSGNCCYHVSHLARRGTFTMKEYQQHVIFQQGLDRATSCICQKLAVDHPKHKVKMTQGGFILTRIWWEQLVRRYSLSAFRPDMASYRRKSILEVMDNIFSDFMIELSSREQKRPLVLWARVEAMAWFINTFPTTDDWHNFQNWKRPRQCIMLFGIALLTAIDALLQQNLFNDNESRVPNLGLVIALFIQTTWDPPPSTPKSADGKDERKQPFNNKICLNNENGWAAEVVGLAQQHGVRIEGVPRIDYIVDQWRTRKKSFESIRNWARRKRYSNSHRGETTSFIDATLASIAAREGETPARRGKGQRVTWMPEDDYDDNGIRLWKRWFFVREFEMYSKEHEVTDES